MDMIESTVSKASLVYESQLNIKLQISRLRIYETSWLWTPTYADDECNIFKQINSLTWWAFKSGGAVHLFTGCGNGAEGVLGVAFVGSMCSETHNTAVSQLHDARSWITFAHELGHNFGAGHSFEEGQKTTGGLMDYGDGKLNGEYQFNTRYRKIEMCETMNEHVNTCHGYFHACADCDGLISHGSPLAKPCSIITVAIFLLFSTSALQ